MCSAGYIRPMTKNPIDPVKDRRPAHLVTIGFRTTPEQRDALNTEARKRKASPSSLIRAVLDSFLEGSR